MERHRGLIIIIVAVVAVVLVGFWVWASPILLRTSKDSVSLLGIFKKGYEQAREQVTAVKNPFSPSETTLSQEQVDQITERLNNESRKIVPKLPTNDQRIIQPAAEE